MRKNEPLDENDFPEALDAFMAAHGELIRAVVLQSFGEEPKTSGVYLRAEPGDKAALDGDDASGRAALIERRLADWDSLANS